MLMLFEDRKTQSRISLELIPFGKEDPITDTYSLNLTGKKHKIDQERKNLHERFIQLNDAHPGQSHTHILAALQKVREIQEDGEYKAFGIYIFSDGALDTNDISHPSLSYTSYLDQIKSEVQSFYNAGNPVFFIQNSFEAAGDYELFHIKEESIAKNDSLFVTANTFWLKSSVDIEDKNKAYIENSFKKFIASSLFQIHNLNTIPKATDEIGRIILVTDILEHPKFKSFIKYVKSQGLAPMASYYESLNDQVKSYDNSLTASLRPVGFFSESKTNLTPDAALEKLNTLLDESKEAWNIEKLQDIDRLTNLLVDYNQFPRLIELSREYFDTAKIKDGEQVLPSFASLGMQAVEPTTPYKHVSSSFEEAVVLGLTDYLIDRAQQEAAFVFYEHIYDKLLSPYPFVKDTLFYHTSNILTPTFSNGYPVFNANLKLMSDALHEDLIKLPSNVVKHPKARSNHGLLSLAYSLGLVNNLVSGKSLESSYLQLVNTLPNLERGTSQLERGFIITGHLIGFLEEHDLAMIYKNLPSEELDKLSKLAIVYLARQYPDIHQVVDVNELTPKVKEIYANYGNLRQYIEQVNQDRKILSSIGSHADNAEYQRKIQLDILRKSIELMVAGVQLMKHFPNSSDSISEYDLYKVQRLCTSAMDIWYYFENEEYSRAASILLPMINDLPLAYIDYGKFNSKDQDEKKNHYKNLPVVIDWKKLNADREILQENREGIDKQWIKYKNGCKSDSGDCALKFLADRHLLFLKPLVYTKVPDAAHGKIEVERLENIEKLEEVYDFLSAKFLSDGSFEYGKLNKFVTEITDEIYPKKGTLVQIDPGVINVFMQYVVLSPANDELKKLITVAAEVSSVQTAKDFHAIVQSYAMPVASYRVKRYQSHSLMVNAYVGLGPAVYLDKGSTLAWTLNAPIGLNYNPWTQAKHKRWSGISFFVPVIDVGNIINYRINASGSENVTDQRAIMFENIISPGLHLMYQPFEKFPLAIGGGWQSNPNRALFHVSFDLPLFNISFQD